MSPLKKYLTPLLIAAATLSSGVASAANQVILLDTFQLDDQLRTVGKPLDSTLTMSGGQIWKAGPAILLNDEGFSFVAVDGNPGPMQASVELDPDAIAGADILKFEVVLDIPKRDATPGRFVAFALARTGDSISTNGCLWLNLGLHGRWALMRFAEVLAEGDIYLERGETAVEILYDQVRGVATAKINGEKVATDVVVPGSPQSDRINHAIVHFQWCDKTVKLKKVEISSVE